MGSKRDRAQVERLIEVLLSYAWTEGAGRPGEERLERAGQRGKHRLESRCRRVYDALR